MRLGIEGGQAGVATHQEDHGDGARAQGWDGLAAEAGESTGWAKTGAVVSGALPAPRFTPSEQRLIARLRTPEQVQAWLLRMPYNWERAGETNRTLRGVLRHKKAHCLEAALCAAAILEQHGFPPLLMDLESVDLLDHVIYVFQRGGKWGSIARSRCAGLHGRKPVFASLAALADSYRAPFIDTTGRMKGFGVLDLRTLKGNPWRTSTRNVPSISDALNANRHTPSPTPEPEFRTWKVRFDAWWEANGRPAHDWPVFEDYPRRETWLWP